MSELTTTSWLILADDLTGAADAAVPFALRSLDSRVLCAPGPLTNHSEAQVIACNVESRTASREEAIRLNRLALAQHSQTDRRLFKKIDSLFRGHPAEEIAVALDQQSKDGARAFGILAPAFPATGRTTVNGQVHVHGRPLDLTGGSQHRLNRNNVDLIELLSRAELSAAVVPLEVVRDSESLAQTLERLRSEGHDVAICDATEQSDLQCIARAGVEFEDAVLIGSAGLASAIAAFLPKGSAIGTRVQKTRPVLTVIGSQASESHRSARRLI
ncbi:MAG: four-carbon acid sugar kinase family protein, partial [Povalibacter sp.]